MEVSIIIPVYNHLELTRECLKSLKETTTGIEYEVILVDDGSDAETKKGIKELVSGPVKLIEAPVNQGFAHANNLGALHARGKYLVLANNDLVFLPKWLPPMLAAFRKEEAVGLVGNVQLNASSGEIDHAGVYIAFDTTVCHRSKIKAGLFKKPAFSRTNLLTAACCAIPKDLFRKLGGFDEAFLNGGEDIDLCFRVMQQGYRIMIANQSVVKHHISATRKGTNLNTERNSRLLQRKWGDQIAKQAASRWPDQYVSNLRNPSSWQTIKWEHLRQALARFFMIEKGPAPAAIPIVTCELERKERHWKSLLDGWSDEKIRTEERKKHSSPLQDSYETHELYSAENRSGVWIKEKSTLTLARGTLISDLSITGKVYAPDANLKEEIGDLGLAISVNDSPARTIFPIKTGDFSVDFQDPPVRANEQPRIEITLLGTVKTNAYAYLGRVLRRNFLIPKKTRQWLSTYRAQKLNQRLQLESLLINSETVFDFVKNPTNPLNTEYALRHASLGINLVGWFKAQLGIGESARIAAKVLKASDLPYSFVPLKVNCLASQGDDSLDSELTESNPHPINVFHIDAPQSADIDHHHGPAFRQGKRNIAYWAWELPEFPDKWIQYFKYFDEIWTPSNFVRDAVALKSPVPVITVPHCIDFSIPERDYRKVLDLPNDKFLFSFAYDLNSYQERKNPKAVIDAYRSAFSGSELASDVGLVIKIHSSEKNRAQYNQLLEYLKDVPNYYLVDRTLSREDTYGLMKASDCYVSLHRSEGFGLTVAESMFLEKPVISTNWSATSEFVNAENGCPVAFKLTKLKNDFGPYQKGQIWADPDPEDAARHMVNMIKNPERAQKLGQRAALTIKELYSPERIATIYRNRLRALALW